MKYVIPSISGKQGEIVRLMNKKAQVYLARKLDIPMLDVKEMELNLFDTTLQYPVILKPVISAEGQKTDIMVANNETELRKIRNNLIEKGYSRILVQHFLSNKTEYVVTGAIFGHNYSFTVVEHIRQWPMNTGSGSFSKFCTNKDVNSFAKLILEKLQYLGFQGPIDLEFFKDNDSSFYLNEINWRSSGRNFVSEYTNVHPTLQYYRYMIGEESGDIHSNSKEGYTMNEGTDIRHVLGGGYSLRSWLRDVRKTDCFALWSKDDLKPTFAQYLYYAKRFIRR